MENHASTANDIALMVNGDLEGNPALEIEGVHRIEEDVPYSLTFLANLKYARHLYQPCERTILVHSDYKVKGAIKATLIRVDNVYESLAVVLDRFKKKSERQEGLHATAVVHKSSLVAANASIGAFSVIGSESSIGAESVIGNHVSIGKRVKIGSHCRIHPGVRIYDHTEIGDRVVIYANAVIGSDGFGFARKDHTFRRIPHIGKVIVEDDVEIGSNTCIDRGSIGATVIRKGAKLDNLIQVAHNVEIGAYAAIAAQTGISGSARIGTGSVMGGQSGVAGHVVIPPGSQIQAQSGIASDLDGDGKKWYGTPAFAYFDFLRSFAWFKKLPSLVRRIERLEDRLKK